MSVSVSKLSRKLSEYLNRAAFGAERIVVTSRGTPKAAIISVEDLERLEELEESVAELSRKTEVSTAAVQQP